MEQELNVDNFIAELQTLRQKGDHIVNVKLKRAVKIESFTKTSYIECAQNFAARLEFLNSYEKKIYEEEKSLNKAMEDIVKDLVKQKKDPNEKKEHINYRQLESKLKTLEFWKSTLDAEREREELFKASAMEKYMDIGLDMSTR